MPARLTNTNLYKTLPNNRRFRPGVDNLEEYAKEPEWVKWANGIAATVLMIKGGQARGTKFSFNKFLTKDIPFSFLWTAGIQGVALGLTKATGGTPDYSGLKPSTLALDTLTFAGSMGLFEKSSFTALKHAGQVIERYGIKRPLVRGTLNHAMMGVYTAPVLSTLQNIETRDASAFSPSGLATNAAYGWILGAIITKGAEKVIPLARQARQTVRNRGIIEGSVYKDAVTGLPYAKTLASESGRISGVERGGTGLLEAAKGKGDVELTLGSLGKQTNLPKPQMENAIAYYNGIVRAYKEDAQRFSGYITEYLKAKKMVTGKPNNYQEEITKIVESLKEIHVTEPRTNQDAVQAIYTKCLVDTLTKSLQETAIALSKLPQSIGNTQIAFERILTEKVNIYGKNFRMVGPSSYSRAVLNNPEAKRLFSLALSSEKIGAELPISDVETLVTNIIKHPYEKGGVKQLVSNSESNTVNTELSEHLTILQMLKLAQ